MERRFARKIGSLASMFAFIDEFLHTEQLGGNLSHDLALLVEELFTNMVRHGHASAHEVEVRLSRDAGVVTLILRDFDVEPFDVTRPSSFDPETPLADRGPGGMGLHLVQRIADTMAYDYADRVSTITITKRIEG
jgi:anti-sigma regulatory factor (Ser/Thr protein kinase)